MVLMSGRFYTLFLILDLSPEQQEMQQLARKFAREEMLPVAAHHDQTGEVSMPNIQGSYSEKKNQLKAICVIITCRLCAAMPDEVTNFLFFFSFRHILYFIRKHKVLR